MKNARKYGKDKVTRNGERLVPIGRYIDEDGRWRGGDDEYVRQADVEANGGTKTLQSIINRLFDEVMKGQKDPVLQEILRKQVERARKGDIRSAEFLLDRAFGKPTQTVVQQGTPVVNIQHNVIGIEDAKQINE